MLFVFGKMIFVGAELAVAVHAFRLAEVAVARLLRAYRLFTAEERFKLLVECAVHGCGIAAVGAVAAAVGYADAVGGVFALLELLELLGREGLGTRRVGLRGSQGQEQEQEEHAHEGISGKLAFVAILI